MATVGSRAVERVVGKLIEWCYVWGTDIVLVVVGVLFIGIGLGIWSTQRPIEGGIVTTGQIVDQVTRTDSDGEEMKFPVVEFTDERERAHRFENEIGGGGVGGVQGTIGQVVKVRYDPDEPSRAQWADRPGAWIPLVAIGVGAAVLLVELGLVARRACRRRGTGESAAEPGT